MAADAAAKSAALLPSLCTTMPPATCTVICQAQYMLGTVICNTPVTCNMTGADAVVTPCSLLYVP